MLASSTVICAEAQTSRKIGSTKIKERVKVCSSLICREKIRTAVQYICERKKGGILIPGDIDEKTGKLV